MYNGITHNIDKVYYYLCIECDKDFIDLSLTLEEKRKLELNSNGLLKSVCKSCKLKFKNKNLDILDILNENLNYKDFYGKGDK